MCSWHQFRPYIDSPIPIALRMAARRDPFHLTGTHRGRVMTILTLPFAIVLDCQRTTASEQ